MCGIDGAESPKFYKRVMRRAAKDHRCFECKRGILKGETYSYETALWYSDVETMKICAHCEKARDWLGDECGGWVFGSLAEELEEHFRSGHKEIGRLVVMMSNGWKRLKSPTLYPVELVAKLASAEATA